jgi:HD-GYP domain-containing protein (c-di-GMP phosphodiesterase class II)
MTASLKSREIQIPIESLRRGLFVSSLDRAWSDTPFAFQGFLIEAEYEIDALRKLCRWVAIDTVYSDPAALRAVAPVEAAAPPATRKARPAEPALKRAATSTTVTPRGQPIPWLRRAAKRRKPVTGARRSREAPATAVPLPENERLPLVPPQVPLVRYRDETPFEREIDSAGHAATLAGEALKTLLDDMARGGELNLAELRSSAQDLAASVVRNPDALQWLVRMRDRDAAVYAHGVKVAVYLLSFARHLGFAPAELVQMATIGLLLDVGKIYIDQALLRRAGPLTPEERARVEQHVGVGVDALQGAGSLSATVLDAIAQHHERVDGTGYPRQLNLEAISFHGRMAAIADSFAAMTSRRAYAPAMAPFEAMKVLYAEAGAKFHAPLVEQFVQAVGIFPTGALVELSSGEVAVVVCHNRVRRLEPRVLVVTDATRRRLDVPFELDLMTQSQPAVGVKPVRIDRGLAEGSYGLDLGALYAGRA